MIRQLIILVLSVALAFSISGCGKAAITNADQAVNSTKGLVKQTGIKRGVIETPTYQPSPLADDFSRVWEETNLSREAGCAILDFRLLEGRFPSEDELVAWAQEQGHDISRSEGTVLLEKLLGVVEAYDGDQVELDLYGQEMTKEEQIAKAWQDLGCQLV